MYDIIGDIHGHADELVALLKLLKYELANGVYRHPSRKVIFVGDFIDRGPQIREVLHLVRSMHEAGSALAVMGNHEFNALAYHTPDPDNSGRYLRDHSPKNTKQHAATVEQVPDDELKEYLNWFRQLPMWLTLDGVRVVHACWDADQMGVIQTALDEHGGVSSEFLCQATTHGTQLYQAIEDVLKGKEVRLPEGKSYCDKDGNERHAMRIKWFGSPVNETYASYALTAADGLPTDALPATLIESVTPYPPDADPVFFGHYWLRADRPSYLASNVACLDYSVAKGGSLCAYCWNRKVPLRNDRFLAVRARGS
jgi:hypothetical protein